MKRTRFLWALPILWLAFGLRLYHLDFQSIWWDEGHSIFVASRPIPQIPTLPAMDVHPPAYFALLHVWMNIAGTSEFALRYLSVVFSLLTIALLWRFAHALTHPISLSPYLPISSPAPLAALFAALSPLYVAYAQEVRSYALITFLALGSTFALWQIVRVRTLQTARWPILYIVLTTACLYTHYFTVFLLLFQNVIWIIWIAKKLLTTQKTNELKSDTASPNTFALHLSGSAFRSTLQSGFLLWSLSQVSILLLFLPQLRLALRQVTTYTNPNLSPPSLTYFISHTWQAYTVGLTIDPTPAKWGMWGVISILVIGYLLLVIRHLSLVSHQSSVTTPNQSLISNLQSPISPHLFLLIWFLLPLVAYYLILQRQPSFEPRYMMLVTPALFLLLAISVSLITYHLSRSAYYVLLLILLTIFTLSLHSYYTNETYFKDDSAGVAAWLAQETTPNDIVFVDVPHPFHYYADKIPALTTYLFVDIHTAAETLNREAAGKNRLYWVTWHGSDTDPRGVIPFLAEKAGQPLGQRDFKGYQVRWYQLPAAAHFNLSPDLLSLKAIFGDVLCLDGAAYADTSTANEPVWATLHFSLLRPTDVDYRVSLRLRDAAGNLVQDDRDLLNDRHFRTSAWPIDDPALNQAINVYLLPPVSPGDYQLEVVLYNAQPPYPSEGVSGIASHDPVSAILGKITILP